MRLSHDNSERLIAIPGPLRGWTRAASAVHHIKFWRPRPSPRRTGARAAGIAEEHPSCFHLVATSLASEPQPPGGRGVAARKAPPKPGWGWCSRTVAGTLGARLIIRAPTHRLRGDDLLK